MNFSEYQKAFIDESLKGIIETLQFDHDIIPNTSTDEDGTLHVHAPLDESLERAMEGSQLNVDVEYERKLFVLRELSELNSWVEMD